MQYTENNPIRRPHLALLLALALCFAIGACTTAPTQRGGAAGQPVQNAQRALAQGDFARAAQLYADAAQNQTNSQRRNTLYLQAALTALRGQQVALARRTLAAIDSTQLDAIGYQRYALAQHWLQLAPLPAAEALAQLPPPASDVPPELAADVWAARASLLFEQYKYVDGIHNLVQRSVWLADKQAMQRNSELIFQRALQAVELGRGSDSAAAHSADATTLGWLRLAEIKTHGPRGGAALQQALQRWEQHFPGHPATRHVLPTVFNYQPTTLPGTIAHPGKPLGPGPIMLALPLSGQLARPGEAIRAGFEAAHDNASTTRRLLVVDSAAMPARAILGQARSQGAALIVGPLAKAKVGALAQLAPRMPVLALNELQDATAPPTFYRYALAPEDDARTAASHAAANGWHNALVLAPQGDWGERVLDAFRRAFAKHGGNVVDYAFFDNQKVNHKAAVRAVLQHYHGGGAVDFVFIAAEPFHARMLNSQLRFYHAATLPVIATGDIYGGHADVRKNADLNGVAFAAMPWVISPNPRIQALRSNVLSNGGIASKRFPRLFAMGIDAWRLTAEWIATGLQSGATLAGLTGRLEVLPNGRIRRHLAWAQFSNGLAQLLQPANAGATASGPQSAPAWAESAATLKSQVMTTPDSGPTDFGPVPDASASSNQLGNDHASQPATTTPAQTSNPERDTQRQQRASEVSRLIDMADGATTTAVAPANAAANEPANKTASDAANATDGDTDATPVPVFTNDGGAAGFGAGEQTQ